MADIKVERSSGSGAIWAWIVGIVVVLALIWFFFIRPNNNTAATPATVGLRAAPTMTNVPVPV